MGLFSGGSIEESLESGTKNFGKLDPFNIAGTHDKPKKIDQMTAEDIQAFMKKGRKRGEKLTGASSEEV